MPEITMIYDVIVGWGNNASRNFIFGLICSIIFTIILFFSLVDFF